jgi:hypothetical protein
LAQHSSSAPTKRVWEAATKISVAGSWFGMQTASHILGPARTMRRYQSPPAPGIGVSFDNGRRHTFGARGDIDVLLPVRFRNATTGHRADGSAGALLGLISLSYAPAQVCMSRCLAVSVGAGAGLYSLGSVSDATENRSAYAPISSGAAVVSARDVAVSYGIAPSQVAFAGRVGIEWRPANKRVVLSLADNMVKFRPLPYAAGISPMHHLMFSVGFAPRSSLK